jgi:hypothetical protein
VGFQAARTSSLTAATVIGLEDVGLYFKHALMAHPFRPRPPSLSSPHRQLLEVFTVGKVSFGTSYVAVKIRQSAADSGINPASMYHLSRYSGFSEADSHNSKSDAYHTCYVLAGLSSAQHKWHFNTPSTKEGNFTADILSSAYQWTSEPIIEKSQIFDDKDRVGTLHPVFVIPEGVAEETRAYFASKGGF